MEIKNAKIESTMLGYEDHGILTIWLQLDYGGSGQGFGGYALDTYSEEKKERVETAYCGKWIKEILRVVGVDKWEDLKGKYIRVEVESGWNGKILKIGNFLKDEWFNPKELSIN